MVVAVGPVGMMEVSVDEVVDVVAVRDRFVATAGAVDVSGIVRSAGVLRGAISRVGCRQSNAVLVDVAVMEMVQVTIVQVVDVVVVAHGGMAAARFVLMGMLGMNGTGGHGELLLGWVGWGNERGQTGQVGPAFAGVSESVEQEVGDVLVGKAVEDVFAVAAPGDEAFVAQDAQTLGDGGKVVAGGGDLGDARFPLSKQGEQAQTRGIAHSAEDARGALDGARTHEGGGRTGAVIVGGAGGINHFWHGRFGLGHLINCSTIKVCDSGCRVKAVGRCVTLKRIFFLFSMKRALITGVTGQDGSYLAEFLLRKGYEVHGIKRRSSSFNTGRVDGIFSDLHEHGNRFFLHFGDLSDTGSLWKLLHEIKPDEVYNLAAQSHVRVSFDIPESTGDITGMGAVRLLEGIKQVGLGQTCRFYQASSSEMFGAAEPPQHEGTVFHPRSPYACAKLYAHWLTINYRESYNMFAVSGILFNHESPRRGETFVTRKIARAVANIKNNLQEKLYLGNLDSKRDWGFAKEYVEAMWLMLQQEKPEDYVIGTGETHTVREFVEEAFGHVNLEWEKYVEFDARYLRPAEVDALLADPSKARQQMGWEHQTGFRELVKLMVDAEMDAIAAQRAGVAVAVSQHG